MATNIGILVSGRGSNLQSIIDHVENEYLENVSLKVVISNTKDAYALQRARNHGIDDVFIDASIYKNKNDFEKKIISTLEKYNVDLVLLAGYMKILGSDFIHTYRNRIINIHPALLPAFKGLHGPQQALEYGAKVAGCTVHFVDEGVDSGPIILQKCVVVKDDDTEESLAARILEQEHKIFPQAIKLFTEGKLKVNGRIVLHEK